ncbi:MAG: SGNH/GDSL hydrolase family protein [Planctomycetota bacterium]|nr:SGNH/GDSL hydrolase family protein [Planctomycetota bacterium]
MYMCCALVGLMLAVSAWSLAAEDSAPAASAYRSPTMEKLAAGQAQTIVTYGTSLTAGGAWVKGLEEELKNVCKVPPKVVNCGMSGKNSDDGVKQIASVLNAKPDLVFIEFAMNDAVLRFNISVEQARTNLETIIGKIQTSKPGVEIILMTMNPPTNAQREGKRPEIEAYYEMYRATAKKFKLGLIDHFAAWNKLLKDDPKTFKKYVPDDLHPNAEGSAAVTLPGILTFLGMK